MRRDIVLVIHNLREHLRGLIQLAGLAQVLDEFLLVVGLQLEVARS
jgi:hypothetical protein